MSNHDFFAQFHKIAGLVLIDALIIGALLKKIF